MDIFLTPLIRGFSTDGSHRRVSEGAGALRFYTMPFPMVGSANWRGDYLLGASIGEARIHPRSKNPQTKNHASHLNGASGNSLKLNLKIFKEQLILLGSIALYLLTQSYFQSNFETSTTLRNGFNEERKLRGVKIATAPLPSMNFRG